MKFLGLAIRHGDELLVTADGPDAAEAVEAICTVIRQKADEEQAEKELREKRGVSQNPRTTANITEQSVLHQKFKNSSVTAEYSKILLELVLEI